MKDTEWLTAAWMQRALDALRDTLHVEPDLRKQFIEFLFDTGSWDRSKVTWENAVTRYNACLNPGSQSYFKLSELWILMKRFGRHQLFLAMAEDLGYEVRIKPTDERQQELLARLASALEAATAASNMTIEDLRRLAPDARALRIHPAIAEGSTSFDLPGMDAPHGERGF